MNILDLPMQENDANAATIRDYLMALLLTLWNEADGFSGKRPFGNSDWEWDLYYPLIEAGIVAGKFESDDEGNKYISDVDDRAAWFIIENAIKSLGVK